MRIILRHMLLVALLLTTLAPGLAAAQVPSPSPLPEPTVRPTLAPTAPTRPGDLGPWWRDSELAAEIDLDHATVDSLEQLFLDHRLRLAELAAELDRVRAAVDFERHRSDADTDALVRAEDELFDVRGQMEAARAELLVEVRALLSAEQWTQLDDYRARHRLPAPRVAPVPRVPRILSVPRPGEMPRPRIAPVPSAPGPPSVPEAPRPPLPSERSGPTAEPPTAPAPPAPPAAPSAPLPPAPPALSWWTDASVRSDLDLDADQLRRLEIVTGDAAPRLQDLQKQVRSAETELSRLVAATDLDRDAARRQVDRLTEARRRLLDAGRALEHQLLDVLTPDQRRRLTRLDA